MATGEESVILFSAIDETEDNNEEDGQDEPDSPCLEKEYHFGACLRTSKKSSKTSFKCHQICGMDLSKQHGIFEKLREDDRLIAINNVSITTWSHSVLMKFISHLDERVIFVFHRESKKNVDEGLVEETDEEFIEVTFDVSTSGSKGALEDKGMGDFVSRIKTVTVKVIHKLTFNPRLTVMASEDMKTVKVIHGALRNKYMKVDQDRPVMDDLFLEEKDAYIFEMYTFSVCKDKNNQRPLAIAAFKSVKKRKFLMCTTTSNCLTLVKDDDINSRMTNVTSNAPYLFYVTVCTDGEGVFLESVLYKDHYLAYDIIDNLHLQVLHRSSSSNPTDVMRNFSFSFV